MPARVRWLFIALALLLPRPSVAGVQYCPGAAQVKGIDVSKWQGAIDWTKVKGAGYQFAICRVSNGTGINDEYFDANWKGIKSVGMIRGVYQFFRPGQDAAAQANLLLAKIGKLGPGDLPPVIDVEETDGQPPSVVAAKVATWISIVEAATGKKPIIYTGTWFWDPNVASNQFGAYPLWQSWYCTNCCPKLPNAWSKFVLWQHSSTGSVPGISGNVDLNIYDGSLQALQTYAGMDACKPHCEGSKIIGADCGAGDCAAFGATCVDDALGVRCASVLCPALGTKKVCLPGDDHGGIATCKDGALTEEGDCGAFGAWCSTVAGPEASCVSAFCTSSPDLPPWPHLVCLPDGQRYACNALGELAPNPCPGGTECVQGAENATCETPIGPCGDCDDGNPCTDDGCGAGAACEHVPNTMPCEDGDPCTADDTCANGVCAAGTVVCSGGDAGPSDSGGWDAGGAGEDTGADAGGWDAGGWDAGGIGWGDAAGGPSWGGGPIGGGGGGVDDTSGEPVESGGGPGSPVGLSGGTSSGGCAAAGGPGGLMWLFGLLALMAWRQRRARG